MRRTDPALRGWERAHDMQDRDRSPTLKPSSMPHLPQLDGIRALAVGLVFLSHAGLGHIVPGGLGVTIFFFLSGYLITTLLRFEALNTGGVSLRNFYLRRVFRIFPPLYLTLLFCGALYALGLLKGPYDAGVVLMQATFAGNYVTMLGGDIAHALPVPLWSLAVEEHFYLLFPLVFLLAVGRISAARLALFCLIACFVVLSFRVAAVMTLADASDTYIWTHTRADSILFGCCLALWRNPLLDGEAGYRPGGWQALAALGVIGATLVVRDETFRQTLRYTVQGGALFVLFACILQPARGSACGRAARLLSAPLLTRIGLYSYTIYLVHAAMIEAMAEFTDSHLVQGIAGAALTFVYAALMHRLVERPFARLRRRLDAPGAGVPAREAPLAAPAR
ncbi:acyltransferase family protein [Methylorubrum salsuginis]|uniref:Peptidoglycan/LPS O-acetylase OafA/YrhL, contains acyltransferase and SGNH-hydrolase domains n=1 Tax=Methylorubrum salsuginis TaxID=414703 RepID=A0A1I4AC32_9HYPH|nr:acyltransferase [Methylorubrum salsuginis]SFK53521.1 Peptidoglycan/LPS O-acetylase OafA/YrhL, contains acyltransferase and SGNH-hydrolase domains [Methylorubrum salsuginis]